MEVGDGIFLEWPYNTMHILDKNTLVEWSFLLLDYQCDAWIIDRAIQNKVI